MGEGLFGSLKFPMEAVRSAQSDPFVRGVVESSAISPRCLDMNWN